MARNRGRATEARRRRKFRQAAEAHIDSVHEIVRTVAALKASDDPRIESEPTVEERLFVAAWRGYWLGRTGTLEGAGGDAGELADIAAGNDEDSPDRR